MPASVTLFLKAFWKTWSATGANVKLPLPSVCSLSPFVPSEVGSVNSVPDSPALNLTFFPVEDCKVKSADVGLST